MAKEWGLLLKRGFSFAWKPKRWLPFFITDFVCALLAILYINFNIEGFLGLLSIISLGDTAYLPGFSAFLAPLVLIGIACGLMNLWIKGALIHQSQKEKEFRKSWGVSCKRYLSMLGAMILTGIFTYLVSLAYLPNLPSAVWIGSLLSFLVSAMLYFPLQIVIIKKRGFREALVGSWQLFQDQAREKLMKKKNILLLIIISEIISMPALIIPNYLGITTAILTWILCWLLIFIFLSLVAFSRVCNVMIIVGIISLIIVLIFSIPFLLVLYNIMLVVQATYSLGSGAIAILGMKSIIRESLLPLATSGIILLIGASISKTFAIKANTEFYLRFRKRILGLF